LKTTFIAIQIFVVIALISFHENAIGQVLHKGSKCGQHCYLKLECDYCSQPFQSEHHQRVQGNLKHIRIESNCAWKFSVTAVEHHFQNQHGVINTIENIKYRIDDISGDGCFYHIEPIYSLFSPDEYEILGEGTVEFDVVFDIDCASTEGWRWGNYSIKINFGAISIDK
jgi:hypothetical protein